MIDRQTIREPMAELAGVAIFVLFGTGVNCSVALSKNRDVASSPKGVRLAIRRLLLQTDLQWSR